MSSPCIYIAIAALHPLVRGAEKQALVQARSLRERANTATIITFRAILNWGPGNVDVPSVSPSNNVTRLYIN